jgi:two-component system sensor histidine kinase ChvG
MLRLTRRRLRIVSPLTVRILFVNLFALTIPIVGSLFLAQYQQRLIDNELASLQVEASLYAVAIAEGCATTDLDDNMVIVPTLAKQMIRHLSSPTLHAQLFDPEENLVADSHKLIGPGGAVQLEELPPLHAHPDVGDEAMAYLGEFLASIPGRGHLPSLPRKGLADTAVLDTMRQALDGNISSRVWLNGSSGLVFVAAAPVQDLESVLGAVMVVHDGREVDSAIRSLRLDMLKVSGLVLATTAILSIYLARKISRPIRKLAAAAIAQTEDLGQGRRIDIPDFNRRRDEIGDLSVAMRQMTEALWARMDAIDRFAADVAHELKNPLTSLRSAVETVGRVEDPERKARLLEIITEDVVRMDRLISDISSASRLDAELSRVEQMPVDVCDVLRTAAAIHAESGSPIPVEFNSPPGEKVWVLGIESRLMQVFQNLIQNALSFSPPGGRVTIVLRAKPDMIEIDVEDDGPGIPENKLADIFERFYTERPAGEAFGKHSGLGLSISKQIVDAHRGRISATNRRNDLGGVTGARFTIVLPRYTRRIA